ncbi:hypothetical protein AB6813_11750 [bacterium RCC_150]
MEMVTPNAGPFGGEYVGLVLVISVIVFIGLLVTMVVRYVKRRRK